MPNCELGSCMQRKKTGGCSEASRLGDLRSLSQPEEWARSEFQQQASHCGSDTRVLNISLSLYVCVYFPTAFSQSSGPLNTASPMCAVETGGKWLMGETFAREQRPLRVIQTQKAGWPLPPGSPCKSSTAPGSPSSRAKLHRGWVCILFNKDGGFLSSFLRRMATHKSTGPTNYSPSSVC